MPPSAAAAAAAAPFGAPAFWVPGTASGVCVGQPLMIFMVQPSPVALQPSGKPPPPAQVAVPWAARSPAVTAPGQPGQGAILPPGQPEAHIPRWPGSPYGEGAAPPLEPQPQPRSLPSSTSLLDELLAAAGVPASPGPSPGAAACGLFHYLRDMVQMLYSELHAFCGALFFWPLPAMNPVCTTIFLVWALLPLPMLIPPP